MPRSTTRTVGRLGSPLSSDHADIRREGAPLDIGQLLDPVPGGPGPVAGRVTRTRRRSCLAGQALEWTHRVPVEAVRSVRVLAEIVRDVRARAYEVDPFEDSYAAYCFYGDPMKQ